MTPMTDPEQPVINAFRYVVEIKAATAREAGDALNAHLQQRWSPSVVLSRVYLLEAVSGVDGTTVSIS